MSARWSFLGGVTARLPELLPPSRALSVRSADCTRLHTRVFGPPTGYPIVLIHGFACAIRAWAYQIADLATDYRVIAFDQRGHGRSDVPGRRGYTLARIASDLDAVLEATLARHERALIAGHSMGGITLAAWTSRYSHNVRRRADAVALINTMTGDLLRETQLLQVPRALSSARVLAGRCLINAFSGVQLPGAARIQSRYLVPMLALGDGVDPRVAELVFQMFEETSPLGRGGCARMLTDALGSRHLSLAGLTVPTLVIGSQSDRLAPLSQSRRIARAAPNLVDLVELPGGHCSMLEQHREVNRLLRATVRIDDPHGRGRLNTS
ncbi:Non-heme bromoperoxidase BPO-A2 [Mycobacterium simulans]|uniref:Non-heme bromoperoxidase BPO-A2 n=1 Tax=Mycobacterium simulans TaxID=627089 RepID=A0A7Z7INF7_9MYCO|nr:alpha/beta hydrolase [Mycobacterium simulans]SOJ56846.1 Non-heme bromoperoxidase BPO-A2 [Mycobacterium simulans]